MQTKQNIHFQCFYSPLYLLNHYYLEINIKMQLTACSVKPGPRTILKLVIKSINSFG